MASSTQRKPLNGTSSRPSRITTRRPDAVGRSAPPRTSLERELRRLERRCDALQAGADAAERARAELLSTLSHDLRNPLSVVLVSARMLARSMGPETPGRRSVEAITRSAEEMNLLLQDFSDAARIEEGRLVVSREPHDLAPLVTLALDGVRASAEAKPLQLSSSVAGDLGPVRCDRERIVKVMSSLLGNAIKFTPKGGSILLRADRSLEGTRISIADTGPGIADEHRARIFAHPFAGTGGPRPAVRRAVTQGVGLALFVAKGVVEAHGGRIWAESRIGAGTTFTFTIPDAVEVDEEESELS